MNLALGVLSLSLSSVCTVCCYWSTIETPCVMQCLWNDEKKSHVKRVCQTRELCCGNETVTGTDMYPYVMKFRFSGLESRKFKQIHEDQDSHIERT